MILVTELLFIPPLLASQESSTNKYSPKDGEVGTVLLGYSNNS